MSTRRVRRWGVARSLWRAAQIVRKRHAKRAFAWGEDGYQTDPLSKWARSFCAIGAMRAACRQEFGATIAACRLRVSAELRARGFRGDIAEWNDDPERTAGEVADLLEAVIIRPPTVATRLDERD